MVVTDIRQFNESRPSPSLMADHLSRQRRSWNMSRIRGGNTAPERAVRSALHALGLRFRLHNKTLPGTPDIVMRRWNTVVFVHGCFWHRHEGCRFSYTPKSRLTFWMSKFVENVARDERARHALTALGWRVITIWACEISDTRKLSRRLDRLFPAAMRSTAC